MNQFNAIRCVMAAALIFVAVNELRAEERSIQEFNALKARWRNFAAIKQTLTLEGRISSIAPTGFRLRNCAVTFQSANGKPLPNLPRKTRTVTITGYLVPDGKRFEFHVTGLKERPTDVEIYKSKKRAIPVGKPEAWYALGSWTRERASFYQDDELHKLAIDAFRTGVISEKELLAGDDWNGLLKLAAKVKALEISGPFSGSWVFEAHRRRWMAYRKSGKPTFVDVIKPLPEDLPGSLTSLESPDKKLAADYAKDPLGSYRKATPAQRPQLHRMFYVEIRLHEILRTALADGSNGLVIAKQIEDAIPERDDLARYHQERGLAHQLKNAGTLNRAEAISFAEMYRDRKEPKKANEVLKRWLKSRIAKRRGDGPFGLLLLADDYEKLLGDKKTAFAFANEAYLKNPHAKGISERMSRMGYTLRNGRWVIDDGAVAGVAKPAEKPEKDPITLGMTQKQVREIMFGAPDSITRVATKRTVHEIWVYGTRAQTRQAIHFKRQYLEPPAQARVVNVTRTRAAPRARR